MSFYKFHTHNLSDRTKPLYRAGRCWFVPFVKKRGTNGEKNEFYAEWYIFYKHPEFNFNISVNDDYNDNPYNIGLNISIPWLFKLYLKIPTFLKLPLKPREIGFNYDFGSDSLRLCLLNPINDNWNSKDKWWWHPVSIDMPWALKYEKTEFLSHDLSEVILTDPPTPPLGKKRNHDWDARENIVPRISRLYKYKYVLKNGTIQNRIATVYASRWTWKAKWFPFIPRKHVRTSIDVTFDSEVGERSGSWKGGVISTGYTLLPNETIEQCVRRMEREHTM